MQFIVNLSVAVETEDALDASNQARSGKGTVMTLNVQTRPTPNAATPVRSAPQALAARTGGGVPGPVVRPQGAKPDATT